MMVTNQRAQKLKTQQSMIHSIEYFFNAHICYFNYMSTKLKVNIRSAMFFY